MAASPLQFRVTLHLCALNYNELTLQMQHTEARGINTVIKSRRTDSGTRCIFYRRAATYGRITFNSGNVEEWRFISREFRVTKLNYAML